MIGKKIYVNVKENYLVRKGGDIELGGRKKEKAKDRKMIRQEAKWLLPPKGWHKANFDRASKGNPGSSRSGGIIKNENGDGIVLFLSPWDFKPTTLRNKMQCAMLSNWLLKLELLIFGLKGIQTTL